MLTKIGHTLYWGVLRKISPRGFVRSLNTDIAIKINTNIQGVNENWPYVVFGTFAKIFHLGGL